MRYQIIILFLFLCICLLLYNKNYVKGKNETKTKENFKQLDMDGVLDKYCKDTTSDSSMPLNNYIYDSWGQSRDDEEAVCSLYGCPLEECYTLQRKPFNSLPNFNEYEYIKTADEQKQVFNDEGNISGCTTKHNPSSNIYCTDELPENAFCRTLEDEIFGPYSAYKFNTTYKFWETKYFNNFLDSNGNCYERDADTFERVYIHREDGPFTGDSGGVPVYYTKKGPECYLDQLDPLKMFQQDKSSDPITKLPRGITYLELSTSNIDYKNHMKFNNKSFFSCPDQSYAKYTHIDDTGFNCGIKDACDPATKCINRKYKCYDFDPQSRTYSEKNYYKTYFDHDNNDITADECRIYEVNLDTTNKKKLWESGSTVKLNNFLKFPSETNLEPEVRTVSAEFINDCESRAIDPNKCSASFEDNFICFMNGQDLLDLQAWYINPTLSLEKFDDRLVRKHSPDLEVLQFTDIYQDTINDLKNVVHKFTNNLYNKYVRNLDPNSFFEISWKKMFDETGQNCVYCIIDPQNDSCIFENYTVRVGTQLKTIKYNYIFENVPQCIPTTCPLGFELNEERNDLGQIFKMSCSPCAKNQYYNLDTSNCEMLPGCNKGYTFDAFENIDNNKLNLLVKTNQKWDKLPRTSWDRIEPSEYVLLHSSTISDNEYCSKCSGNTYQSVDGSLSKCEICQNSFSKTYTVDENNTACTKCSESDKINTFNPSIAIMEGDKRVCKECPKMSRDNDQNNVARVYSQNNNCYYACANNKTYGDSNEKIINDESGRISQSGYGYEARYKLDYSYETNSFLYSTNNTINDALCKFECADGWTKSQDESSCIKCGQGYQKLGNQDVCTKCPSGTYNPTAGGACLPCPKWHNDFSDMISLTPISSIGASNISQCKIQCALTQYSSQDVMSFVNYDTSAGVYNTDACPRESCLLGWAVDNSFNQIDDQDAQLWRSEQDDKIDKETQREATNYYTNLWDSDVYQNLSDTLKEKIRTIISEASDIELNEEQYSNRFNESDLMTDEIITEVEQEKRLYLNANIKNFPQSQYSDFLKQLIGEKYNILNRLDDSSGIPYNNILRTGGFVAKKVYGEVDVSGGSDTCRATNIRDEGVMNYDIDDVCKELKGSDSSQFRYSSDPSLTTADHMFCCPSSTSARTTYDSNLKACVCTDDDGTGGKNKDPYLFWAYDNQEDICRPICAGDMTYDDIKMKCVLNCQSDEYKLITEGIDNPKCVKCPAPSNQGTHGETPSVIWLPLGPEDPLPPTNGCKLYGCPNDLIYELKSKFDDKPDLYFMDSRSEQEFLDNPLAEVSMDDGYNGECVMRMKNCDFFTQSAEPLNDPRYLSQSELNEHALPIQVYERSNIQIRIDSECPRNAFYNSITNSDNAIYHWNWPEYAYNCVHSFPQVHQDKYFCCKNGFYSAVSGEGDNTRGFCCSNSLPKFFRYGTNNGSCCSQESVAVDQATGECLEPKPCRQLVRLYDEKEIDDDPMIDDDEQIFEIRNEPVHPINEVCNICNQINAAGYTAQNIPEHIRNQGDYNNYCEYIMGQSTDGEAGRKFGCVFKEENGKQRYYCCNRENFEYDSARNECVNRRHPCYVVAHTGISGDSTALPTEVPRGVPLVKFYVNSYTTTSTSSRPPNCMNRQQAEKEFNETTCTNHLFANFQDYTIQVAEGIENDLPVRYCREQNTLSGPYYHVEEVQNQDGSTTHRVISSTETDGSYRYQDSPLGLLQEVNTCGADKTTDRIQYAYYDITKYIQQLTCRDISTEGDPPPPSGGGGNTSPTQSIDIVPENDSSECWIRLNEDELNKINFQLIGPNENARSSWDDTPIRLYENRIMDDNKRCMKAYGRNITKINDHPCSSHAKAYKQNLRDAVRNQVWDGNKKRKHKDNYQSHVPERAQNVSVEFCCGNGEIAYYDLDAEGVNNACTDGNTSDICTMWGKQNNKNLEFQKIRNKDTDEIKLGCFVKNEVDTETDRYTLHRTTKLEDNYNMENVFGAYNFLGYKQELIGEKEDHFEKYIVCKDPNYVIDGGRCLPSAPGVSQCFTPQCTKDKNSIPENDTYDIDRYVFYFVLPTYIPTAQKNQLRDTQKLFGKNDASKKEFILFDHDSDDKLLTQRFRVHKVHFDAAVQVIQLGVFNDMYNANADWKSSSSYNYEPCTADNNNENNKVQCNSIDNWETTTNKPVVNPHIHKGTVLKRTLFNDSAFNDSTNSYEYTTTKEWFKFLLPGGWYWHSKPEIELFIKQYNIKFRRDEGWYRDDQNYGKLSISKLFKSDDARLEDKVKNPKCNNDKEGKNFPRPDYGLVVSRCKLDEDFAYDEDTPKYKQTPQQEVSTRTDKYIAYRLNREMISDGKNTRYRFLTDTLSPKRVTVNNGWSRYPPIPEYDGYNRDEYRAGLGPNIGCYGDILVEPPRGVYFTGENRPKALETDDVQPDDRLSKCGPQYDDNKVYLLRRVVNNKGEVQTNYNITIEVTLTDDKCDTRYVQCTTDCTGGVCADDHQTDTSQTDTSQTDTSHTGTPQTGSSQSCSVWDGICGGGASDVGGVSSGASDVGGVSGGDSLDTEYVESDLHYTFVDREDLSLLKWATTSTTNIDYAKQICSGNVSGNEEFGDDCIGFAYNPNVENRRYYLLSKLDDIIDGSLGCCFEDNNNVNDTCSTLTLTNGMQWDVWDRIWTGQNTNPLYNSAANFHSFNPGLKNEWKFVMRKAKVDSAVCVDDNDKTLSILNKTGATTKYTNGQRINVRPPQYEEDHKRLEWINNGSDG
jgi:hypothetical protein